MTPQEETQARLYAEALQKWEHKKNHFFIFGHDGLSFSNWVSDYFNEWKTGNWKLALKIFAAILSFFGLLSLISRIMRIITLYSICSCIAVLPFVILYNYFMYLNYSKNESGIYFGAAFIAIGIGAWEMLKNETSSTFIVAIVMVLIFYGMLRLCKSMYFDLKQPRLEDFKDGE